MVPARRPSDEARRRTALRTYRVLDTGPEETFDRIVRLAQRCLRVPIAFVSFVDSERVWLKAKAGIDLGETARTEAFCAHAILDQQVMVVPDATEDPRFRDDPLVTHHPQIRFYAGAPLLTGPGQSGIGALCVVDQQRRDPSEEELTTLRDLAALVESELELRRVRMVTEREVAMFELSERVARVGHWFYDRQEERLEWSQEAFRIHGVDPTAHQPTVEDALARVHDDDRERVQTSIQRALEEETPYSFDYRLIRPDGEVRRVHARGLIDPNLARTGDYVFGTVHDVTDRYLLEEQVRQSERLASIGTLAAGVAHEINNPLTYIQANLEVIRSGDENAGERAELIEELTDGVERIRRIVHGLKSFSRSSKDGGRDMAVDLADVVERAIRLCRNDLVHRAALVVDPGFNVPPALGDEAQLVQVAVNLLLNAGQAMPSGQAAQHRIEVTVGGQDRDWVYFQVADSGEGMSEETVAQVFSPFFTTKSDADGTGLGLSISHRIVQAHGGRVDIESEIGRGTRIRVLLPVAHDAAKRSLSTDPPPSSAPEHWRVLVIDDDALVRKALVRLLRGHTVHVEPDARRGLEHLKDDGVTYDVILCDLMMPSLTGWDFHAQVAERMPHHAERIIFLTGGAFTPEGRDFVEQTKVPILSKPIDAKTLRAALRSIVER